MFVYRWSVLVSVIIQCDFFVLRLEGESPRPAKVPLGSTSSADEM